MRQTTILEWRMNNDEAETFNMCCSYEDAFIKIFGKLIDGAVYRKNTLPKSTDPRKSNLFRYCWKLRRETRGLLENRQYAEYIAATLTILKMNFENGDKKGKVRVEPNSICGDKAWIRWKVVERWKIQKDDTIAVSKIKTSLKNLNSKAAKDIDRTKKFLFENCGGEPTIEKIESFINKGFFKMWVVGGKVSRIYVFLSPFIKNLIDVDKFWEEISVDPKLVEETITEEVKDYFRYEFGFEYKL